MKCLALGQSLAGCGLTLASRMFDGVAAANRGDRGPDAGLMWTCD